MLQSRNFLMAMRFFHDPHLLQNGFQKKKKKGRLVVRLETDLSTLSPSDKGFTNISDIKD